MPTPTEALILVDIQNDYFPGGRMSLPRMPEAAANAAELLARARAAGTRVIHVRHEMDSPEAPFFRPGSEGAAIHDSVAPRPDETVVLKRRPNSFVGTDLETILRDAGIGAVTVCGAMSQMCVDATVRAASDMGFATTVVTDACAAANVAFEGVEAPADQVHAAIMAPLTGVYATGVKTADWAPAA